MSKNKPRANKKTKGKRATKTMPAPPAWSLDVPMKSSGNGSSREYPRLKNPQSAEEREKWLAKRDALTLRAFQIAYENHHHK
jgi:hypothetical protein